MIGIKVYPNFTLQKAASDEEAEFLRTFKQIKACTKAQFVNYSIFDYEDNTRDVKHFLTYPIGWITHYLRNSYQEIDPVLNLDFRRISYFDWADMWQTGDEIRFFTASQEFGIGDNGVSFITYLGGQVYGVMSLIFDTNFKNWVHHREENLALMRLQSDLISNQYQKLFNEVLEEPLHLTKREMESLYWIAMGKTDAQISDLMKIGRWTVNGHVKALISKLNVPNRTAAVAKAVSTGMLVLDSAFEH